MATTWACPRKPTARPSCSPRGDLRPCAPAGRPRCALARAAGIGSQAGRATVAYRAALAGKRGFGLIEVDASANSLPILERLGFVAVTTTTPYVWSPPC